MEIPNADSHRQYDKAGYLQKQIGRGGFPYLNQWKRRYCVLTKGRLFLYEKDSSKGNDKSTNVVDLKYFDHVAEAVQKETKKASNVFVVTSQDRSFFDPGRHLFAADTLTDMHDWVAKLREAIELIRNNNRPTPKGAKGPVDLLSEAKQKQREDQARPLQDSVDGRIADDKKKDEISLMLDEKLKRESSESKNGGLGNSEKDELKELVRDDLSASKRTTTATKTTTSATTTTTKKIVLQNPSFNVDYKPQLESITKHRIKGPSGRRAPQSRRTMLMKQRASSMSALQPDGDPAGGAAREEQENISAEGEEEDSSKVDSSSLNSSQPILAYHYSSDEDSPVEGDNRMGSDRSIGMAASAMTSSMPPSAMVSGMPSSAMASGMPPPAMASNTPPLAMTSSTPPRSLNIEEVPHRPIKGLRVYLPGEEKRLGILTQAEADNDSDPLLEYRSLPRSLGRSNAGETLKKLGPLDGRSRPFFRELHPSHREFQGSYRGSSGRLSTRTASPEMDALDNLLMKQSIRAEEPTTTQETCLSDQEGSDASTYKAPHRSDPKSSAIEDRELSKALERFASTLQHLQQHTAQLECRTKRIETEFNISKNDIFNLQEAKESIRKDVKKLTDSVSVVSQEALKAKREYVSQRQETEKLQREAAEALSESKKAQEQFEQTRSHYETTIQDLHSLISSIRSSLIVASPDLDDRQTKKLTLAETGKSLSENDAAKIIPEPKKSPKSGAQKGGYHSFFQRPSSIIYGLASKSTNRSFNTKKTKEEKDKAEHESEEKKSQKRIGKEDKRYKSEKSGNQHSLEKNKKEVVAQPFDEVIQQIKTKNRPSEKTNYTEYETEPKRKLPFSIDVDNIPLVDDTMDSNRNKSKTTVGISHVTINVSPPSHNFSVEKSCSSPSVSSKFSQTKPSRPNLLSLSPSSIDVNKSQSNTSSPESPVEPKTFPCTSSELKYPPETKFPTQPANTSPKNARNSAPSALDERSFLRTRPGVFAISKQKSSPNIPLQRQSSGPSYPLQRQHSLGTVPEEGQLPRQASLMSVPEDRPIVDQTLPLSPSPSMVSFPISPSPSGDRLDIYGERSSVRNSMELVTGPVISGSLFQETSVKKLPCPSEFQINDRPMATSSLKKTKDRKKQCTEAVLV